MKSQAIDYFTIDENDNNICYCELCYERYYTNWNLQYHLNTKHKEIKI